MGLRGDAAVSSSACSGLGTAAHSCPALGGRADISQACQASTALIMTVTMRWDMRVRASLQQGTVWAARASLLFATVEPYSPRRCRALTYLKVTKLNGTNRCAVVSASDATHE